jgi:hypothetical protein
MLTGLKPEFGRKWRKIFFKQVILVKNSITTLNLESKIKKIL